MTENVTTMVLLMSCFVVPYAAGEIAEVAPSKVLLDERVLDGAEHPDIRIAGSAEVKDGALVARKDKTLLRVGRFGWRDYVAEFEVRLAPKGRNCFSIQLASPKGAHVWHPCEMQIDFQRDKTGAVITLIPKVFNKETRNRLIERQRYAHLFAPVRKGLAAKLEERGLKAGSWYDRGLKVRIECCRQVQRFWFEGRMVCEVRFPRRSHGPFAVTFAAGDSLSALRVFRPGPVDALYLPLPLDLYLNDEFGADLPSGAVAVDDVPFMLAGSAGGANNLFLKDACWIEHKQDPSNYYGAYEEGEWFAGDPSRPFFRIPADDYAAIWLLAATDPDQALSEEISFRLGLVAAGGVWGRYALHDVRATAPRSNAASGEYVVRTLNTKAGGLFLMRIPLGLALAQDFDDHMTLDVSKRLRLAVRQPDPCRFRIRPLGVPSGVHLLGMTLERSPVRLKVTSPEVGHVFNRPQAPRFAARLENQSGAKQTVILRASATGSHRARRTFETKLSLLPFETRVQCLEFPDIGLGHYALEVTLLSEGGRQMLRRSTTFALLPEDTRDRSVRAPWGTWNFNGSHTTPPDVDIYGPLMRKLGIRFTLGGTDEGLARYGLRNNSSRRTQIKGCSPAIRKYFSQYPNAVKRGLIFHEDAVSGAHVMRLPDCLLDRSPYKFDDAEQERFEEMWKNATEAAKEMRAHFPDVKLQLGNGNPQLVEEFLRRGFPKDLFDTVGNENCSFMRPPEAQPDNVGFSTLWTFRQIMDHYGYQDVPLDICYEWMCRATAPGNLTEEQQADYYVRDALLGLAWGLRFVNPGIVTDVGNGYCFSNWGASGFCHRIPEVNPKPSYVAFATLTLMLDKARFVRYITTNSTSLYCLELKDQDGNYLYALWSTRGTREIEATVSEATTAKLTDWEARTKALIVRKGTLMFTVDTSPIYLTTTERIERVIGGAAAYEDAPPPNAQLISRLDRMEDWVIEQDRDLELEIHNFSCPRRKGNFQFEQTQEFEGSGPCIKVEPGIPNSGTPIQPMYAVLALKEPVTLKGTPREVGLMVNGNSGWGRVIFELDDARGQRWVSIGASQNGTPTRWMADWLPADELARVRESSVADWNTNDSEARSAINFDGWRYLSFPLPGQYPGEGYHWPRNCYWKSDKDGKVHYPLRFRKLIIELREKVVYVTDFIPPRRKEIYVEDLVARR